ncbi:unnamed protein product [Closterium sp. Naga37s-1]|nr:unnamed protein product [Closterium sp. Naga37s-1]CAI5518994.1 unnamed protein product [Closterium sp. Naga37s-1]
MQLLLAPCHSLPSPRCPAPTLHVPVSLPLSCPFSSHPTTHQPTLQLDSGVIDQLVLGDPDAPRFVFWEGCLRPVRASHPVPCPFPPNPRQLDSGVIDQLVLGDPDAPRFVFWEGRLRPVPAGLLDLPVFDLMSIIGKIRAGLGAFGLRPGAPEGKEESVEEFVRRNLGAEVFERLIEPFCSGVYAGDPSKLSMKAAFGKVWRLEQLGGSIFGGSMKLIKEKQANPPPPRDLRLPKPKGQTVGSFQKGLITLPTGIANKLGDRVRLGWKLTATEKRPGGSGFLLSYDTPEGAKQLSARSLLLTVPSYVAADLLKPYSAAAAAALSSFYYPPVAAVTISYPKEAIREDRLVGGELKGFGQLHPRTQGIVTLGTIYSSVLFPNRAPDGRVLLLCYIGGACNTKIATMSEEDIVKQVDIDVRKMLIKPDGAAPQTHGVRVWPRAIPQFNVGHLDNLAKARAEIKAAGLEGVFLGGNYVAGVALGRCVEGGYERAAEVVQYLKENVAVSK